MRTRMTITVLALGLGLVLAITPVIADALIWDVYNAQTNLGTCLLQNSSGVYYYMFYRDSACRITDDLPDVPERAQFGGGGQAPTLQGLGHPQQCDPIGVPHQYDPTDTILGYERAKTLP